MNTRKNNENMKKKIETPVLETLVWHTLDMMRSVGLSTEESILELLRIIVCLREIPRKKESHDDNSDVEQIAEVWKSLQKQYPILSSGISYIPDRYVHKKIVSTLNQIHFTEDKIDAIISLCFKIFDPRKVFGVFALPKEIMWFMLNLLEIEKEGKILFVNNGISKTISELIEIMENNSEQKFVKKNFNLSKHVIDLEINSQSAIISNLVFILKELKIENFLGDPLRDDVFDKIGKFDYAILNPSYGSLSKVDESIKNELGEFGKERVHYSVLRVLQKISNLGKIAVILPAGILFKMDKATSRFRHELLSKHNLHAVIELPEGVFWPQSSVKTALLILEKSSITNEGDNLQHDVFMAKIFDKFDSNTKTELSEIANKFHEFHITKKIKNSSNLGFSVKVGDLLEDWMVYKRLPSEIKIPENQKIVNLKDIALIKAGSSLSIKNVEKGIELPFLRISDITNGIINDDVIRKILITQTDLRKLSPLGIVRDKDILLSIQGTVGKVALATSKSAGAYVSPQLVAIRIISDKILPEYLWYTLSSEQVQIQIKGQISGSIIPRINIRQVEELKIPLPPIEEQKQIVSSFQNLQSKMSDLQKEIERTKREMSSLGGHGNSWKKI